MPSGDDRHIIMYVNLNDVCIKDKKNGMMNGPKKERRRRKKLTSLNSTWPDEETETEAEGEEGE